MKDPKAIKDLVSGEYAQAARRAKQGAALVVPVSDLFRTYYCRCHHSKSVSPRRDPVGRGGLT